jgi:glycosyltransferase involved in cell wall biosynthesis
MKIAVIGAKGVPAQQGGIEHHCEELYSRIVKQGHCVDLFARSSYTDSYLLHSYNFQGIQVVSLPCLKSKGLDALLSSAIGGLASSRRHYDIVHFHALGPALFSWLPRIASVARVVVTCHGLDWRRTKWSKASSHLLHLGESTAVRFAHRLIVVSEELRSYFMRTYGKEPVYIPNAPSRLGESDPNFAYGTSLGLKQGRYILFLGRLVPEKCPDLLIKTFQTLQPSGWKLVIVGGSSDTPVFTSKLVDMAARSEDVVFTGELTGAYLAEILRGAGLFVLPSEVEGLPMAMLEAMLEGVPVLASNIPVHQQLTAGKRGMLFQVGDLDSCTRCLDWAIHHPQELAAMARNAQTYVQTNYDWDRIATETLRLYTALSTSLDKSGVPVQRSNKLVKAFDLINYAEVKPLGNYLVEAGLVTQKQVEVALAEQEVIQMRLGEILVQRGWINKQTIEYLMEKVILPERAAAKREAY